MEKYGVHINCRKTLCEGHFGRIKCSCGLDEALKELKKAVLFGYDDFSYIDKDSDLENLRKFLGFKAFALKLKRLKD